MNYVVSLVVDWSRMLSVYEAVCYQFISGRSYPWLHDGMFVRNVTDTRVQTCLFNTIRVIHMALFCGYQMVLNDNVLFAPHWVVCTGSWGVLFDYSSMSCTTLYSYPGVFHTRLSPVWYVVYCGVLVINKIHNTDSFTCVWQASKRPDILVNLLPEVIAKIA